MKVRSSPLKAGPGRRRNSQRIFFDPGISSTCESCPRLRDNMHYATLEQDSGVEAALMAVDNPSGDILALVGGRDFNLSQYDRATQARRQTGSSFKAYDYTAAMESGYKPDSIVFDGPATFRTASGLYVPH